MKHLITLFFLMAALSADAQYTEFSPHLRAGMEIGDGYTYGTFNVAATQRTTDKKILAGLQLNYRTKLSRDGKIDNCTICKEYKPFAIRDIIRARGELFERVYFNLQQEGLLVAALTNVDDYNISAGFSYEINDRIEVDLLLSGAVSPVFRDLGKQPWINLFVKYDINLKR